MANSKVDSIKAESLKLRKDLIEAMDQSTKAKEKVKELKEALNVEKKLVIQKDEEVQAALLRTDEECEKVIARFLESDRFSNIQFKLYFKGFELLRRWMMKQILQIWTLKLLILRSLLTRPMRKNVKPLLKLLMLLKEKVLLQEELLMRLRQMQVALRRSSMFFEVKI